MPVDGWTVKTVDELKAKTGAAIAIGPFGSRMKSDCYVASGIPVIRGNNISDTRELVGDMVYIAPEKAEEVRSSIIVADDLFFPHRGSIGLVGIVPRNRVKRYVQSSSLMKLTCDRAQVEPLFLFYFFRSEQGRHELLKNASTVGTPGIGQPLSSLKSIRIPLPPLSEQRAITSLLGSLDDKIELNRRMNNTLEALAQSLFKSWFVDATQSALPKGWRAGTLGEVAENPRRGIQPDEIKTDMAYIGLEHMPRRSIALSEWGHTEELESGKFEFKRGEILFGKLRPYFHKVGVAPLDGVCSTDILVVRPKEPEWFGFVLGHVSSVELVEHTNAASTGTKMPRTNWNDISRYQVALPLKPLAADFTQKIRPLVERVIANTHESRTLAALRDALLPKLLSGELRVPVELQRGEEETG